MTTPARLRKGTAADLPMLLQLAQAALASDTFYARAFGFDAAAFAAYWSAYFTLVLSDSAADVFVLDDERIVACGAVGYAGFPSPAHRVAFDAALRTALGEKYWPAYARFLAVYERVMAVASDDAANTAQVLWLFVEPGAQGTGLVAQFLRQWLASSRRPDTTTLTGFVNADAPRLVAAYRRLGCTAGPLVGFDGLRALRMTFDLPLSPYAALSARRRIGILWRDHVDGHPPIAHLVQSGHDAPAWSPALLRAQELHPASHCERPRAAVAIAQGVPVGVMSTSVVHLLVSDKPFRVLVGGDAMGYAAPSLAADSSHAAMGTVYSALLAALIDQAHAERADGIHLPVLPVDDVALGQAAVHAGFRIGEGLPWALVPLDVAHLGAWPSALRSDYRRTLQRNRRVVASLGLRVSTVRAELDARRLHALYTELADKKEAEEEQFSALRYRHPLEFFAHVLRDPAFQVITLRDSGGVVLAYNIGVTTGDTFQSVIVGLDRDALARGGAPDAVAAYQVLHAEVIARAETSGCRWVVLGTTALDGKARLGAVFRRMREADLALSRDYAAFLNQWPASDEPALLPPCRPWAATAMPVIAARTRRFIELDAAIADS